MPEILKLILNWTDLSGYGVDAVIYSALALVGTGIFLIRFFASMVLGLDGSDEFDVDTHDGFAPISLLSVSAFIMGTGWMGLAARIDWGMGPVAAAFTSSGFGFAMMLLSSGLMFAARKLTREVSHDFATAVGRTGQVYRQIPAQGEGTGQVRVSVSGRSMIVDARSNGPFIEAFADITVVEARDDGVLIVEPSDG